MKSIIKFALAAAVLLSPLSAIADEALLTVRFNAPNVHYQDALFTAVSEAIKTKPTVIFNVVGGPRARQIAGEMLRIGVNPQQINLSNEPFSGGAEEVRIFVK